MTTFELDGRTAIREHDTIDDAYGAIEEAFDQTVPRSFMPERATLRAKGAKSVRAMYRDSPRKWVNEPIRAKKPRRPKA